MQCLDDIEVLDYVERRFPEPRIAEVRKHLDTCRDCLNLIDQLAHTSERPPIDGLTLGRTISSGGMGVIVEAFDTKLERRIALKLPRTDDAIAQRRFEREVKITARLQHPAIVPVYAAGTLDDGEPYYAMRLVEGESLDAAIDHAKTITERLALVRAVTTVTGAIAYAHSQGIIHRDIKPANVLVGQFGEVVVIDWGLARAVHGTEIDAEPALASGSPGPVMPDDRMQTAAGTVVGTPAYMAPEQARGEPVDERADVYAIGALLYHVLRGAPPGRGAPADLATVEELPIDLIAIVAEAMAPDPAKRYRTASELAADLERFSAGRLVGVHAYSVWQLTRRWLRKHRTAVIVASLLGVVLAVTAIVASRKIGTAEQTATVQREATDDLVSYMLADLQTKLTKIGKLDVLEGIGTRIDGYYTALGGTSPSSTDLGRWARSLDILGDVAHQAGDLDKATTFYERALALRRGLEASGAARATFLAEVGTSHAKLGKIQRDTGEPEKALASFEAARAAYAEISALEPTNLERQRQHANALVSIGRVWKDRADPRAARASFDAALVIADQLLAADPKAAKFTTMKLSVLSELAENAEDDGDLARALDLAKQSVVLAEALVAREPTPENQKNLAGTHQRMGDVSSKRGDRQGALAAHRRSVEVFEKLAALDPANASWKSNLALAVNRIGGVERALGHRTEAGAAYERARSIRASLVELDPKNMLWLRELGDSYDRLASIDLDLGHLDAADKRYGESLAVSQKLVATDPKSARYRNDLYVSLGNMARLARARGDSEGALGWFKKRLETAQANVASDPDSLAHQFSLSNAYEDMSTILMDREDAAGARAAAAASLELREKLVASSPDHTVWRRALATSLEDLATSQDDPRVGRTWVAKAITHRRALLAKDPTDADLQVDLVLALTMNARIARAMDDYAPALASQAEALKLLAVLTAKDPKSSIWATHTAQAYEIGGDIAADQKRLDDARVQYEAAIAAITGFLDAELTDAHIAAEVAESTWKLSKVVADKARRATLVREAIAMLEILRRSKRLSPDRASQLAEMRRGH